MLRNKKCFRSFIMVLQLQCYALSSSPLYRFLLEMFRKFVFYWYIYFVGINYAPGVRLTIVLIILAVIGAGEHGGYLPRPLWVNLNWNTETVLLWFNGIRSNRLLRTPCPNTRYYGNTTVRTVWPYVQRFVNIFICR